MTEPDNSQFPKYREDLEFPDENYPEDTTDYTDSSSEAEERERFNEKRAQRIREAEQMNFLENTPTVMPTYAQQRRELAVQTVVASGMPVNSAEELINYAAQIEQYLAGPGEPTGPETGTGEVSEGTDETYPSA